MKEKKISLLLAAIAVMLCASIALSAATLAGQINTEKKLDQFTNGTQDVDQEDDVTIAGQYVIKSTLPISEAYRSGDTSALNDNEKETLDLAKAVLDEIITDGMTDFEKEKAVYEWLTSSLTNSTGILTVIPTNNGDNDNPHDVLKYHSAVCVGYATTFRMFMQMLGIECKVIHSSDLIHSWDLVKLDDGWYHTDCYMDNETKNYRNFNMDDNRCSSGHDWTREYFPAANGKKYNYIFSICEELDSIYDIPQWLVKAIDENKTIVSATFRTEINRENENEAQYMVSRLVTQMIGDRSIDYDWMLNENNQYVLCFYIDYYNNEQTQEIDPEVTDKINASIAEALGIDPEALMENPDDYYGYGHEYGYGDCCDNIPAKG